MVVWCGNSFVFFPIIFICLEKRQVSYTHYQRQVEYQRYLRDYELLKRETERRRRDYYERLRHREMELRRQELRVAEEIRRRDRNRNNQMAQELRQANGYDYYYQQELRRRQELERRNEELRRRHERLRQEQRRYEALALTQNNGCSLALVYLPDIIEYI